MTYFSDALLVALQLIFQLDAKVVDIISTSLKISLIATLFASLFGVILGIWAAISDFIGKKLLQQVLNTLMAMPTVMIGLIFYGLLSRRGPLGDFGLLYTQTAVILGESCLILPIIMNMTMTAVQSTDNRLVLTLKILGANTLEKVILIFSELRFTLFAAVITGFGRAIGEVGAAMMLGGNIQGSTRTMTTAIALESSKGDFELGLALGLVLMLIACVFNVLLQSLGGRD